MDTTDFEREVIDRLARIETKLDADYRELHGNGRPGLIQRVGELEGDLEEVKSRHKWWRELAGWVAAVAATAISYFQTRGE